MKRVLLEHRWSVVAAVAVVATVLISYLRQPGNPPDHPYVLLGAGRRASIALPGAPTGFRALPLERRIYGADDSVASVIQVTRSYIEHIPSSPIAISLSSPPVELQRTLEELPAAVRRLAVPKLMGIFLTAGIATDGFTAEVFPTLTSRDALGGLIALDLSRLHRDREHLLAPNQWMAQREAAAFKPSQGITFEATVDDRNDPDTLFELVLLHELGHVIAIGTDMHPVSDPGSWLAESEKDFPFMALSWQIRNRAYELRPELDYPDHKLLAYYGLGSLDASKARAAYDWLKKSDFTTLLASTSPFDDFAESFATYVHTVLLHKPFELRVLDHGKVVARAGACWNEARCAGKRKILEAFLSGPPK